MLYHITCDHIALNTQRKTLLLEHGFATRFATHRRVQRNATKHKFATRNTQILLRKREMTKRMPNNNNRKGIASKQHLFGNAP